MKPIILKRVCLFIAGFFAFCISRAQMIRGSVTDSADQPLYPATITFIHLPDSIVVRRLVSSKSGFIVKLRDLQADGRTHTKLLANISFIGFDPVNVLLRPDSVKGKDIDLGKIKLPRSGGNLMEVIIRTTIPPVIVKQDTMVYNAGAYKTRPNATVEDLLKKLPGIEVDKDGNITSQGQKVEKIYIDGKEFFLNDPRMASQNLTADMVQSVEAFDASSDKSRFTGIKEPSNKKALNLKLKKDKKKGIFGKVYGGYGTPGSYTAGATLNRFQDQTWLFGNVNSNNLNNLYTGNGFRDAGASPGRQTENTFSLNYRDNWGKSVNGLLNYNGSDNHGIVSQTSGIQTFLNDSSLTQNSKGTSTSNSVNQQLSTRVAFTIDSLNSIIYDPSLSFQHNRSEQVNALSVVTQKDQASYLTNDATTDNSSDAKNFQQGGNLAWQKRFLKKGRFLYANFSESYNNQQQHAVIRSLTHFYDSAGANFNTAAIDQISDQVTGGHNYGLNISYTEPLSLKHILDFGYSINSSRNNTNKKSFDKDSFTSLYDLPDTLTTNHFLSSNYTHHLSIGFNTTGEVFNYQLGLAVQYSGIENADLSRNTRLDQHFVNWFPRASAFYAISKGKNINFNYRGSSTNPSIDQLQPLPDLSNPLLIKIGNPSLKQQFDHAIDFSYSSFNQSNFTNFLVQVNGDYPVNKIVPSNVTLASGVQQIQYINVNGSWALNSDLSYGLPINHSRHGNVKFNTVIQLVRDISFINNAENLHNGFTAGERVNLNYNLKDKLFIELRAGINYNSSDYSIQQTLRTQLLTQQYTFDFSYVLPFQFMIAANYNLQATGSQGGLSGRDITIVNASLYKNVLHNHNGEIRFSAFNLFNNTNNFSQSTGSNFISTQSSNTIGRILLLSFVYRARHFEKPGKSA